MAAPDPTLLLQELLSPRSHDYDQNAILQLLTYHLSTLELDSPHLHLVTLIARYTLSSPSLWPDKVTRSASEFDQADWDGRTAIYAAFFRSILLRLDSISREVGTGFRARRSVSKYLEALSQGLWLDQVRRSGDSDWGTVEPVDRLLVASAVLAALQEWKRRKERLWVGGRGMLDRIESEAGKAWQDWVAHGDTNDPFPAWIAAQTISAVSADVLAKHFASTSLLSYLTDSFTHAFDEGNLFTAPPLSSDLEDTAEGLLWHTPSPSHSHLSKIVAFPLFGVLGPLSRALGRALSSTASLATSYDAAVAEPAVVAIRNLSHSLFTVTTRLSITWAATPWSDLVEDSALAPPTRSQTQPWTILKSLLFAQTLVYSSLLEIVSSNASDLDDEPTSGQRELAREAVVALGRTYFVASRFGQGGFKAWRAVLAGLVDVAAAPSSQSSPAIEDRLTPAEELARKMESPFGDVVDGTHSKLVDRAECTFWMNTIEQVMEELSDSYVEDTVLPKCKPYLTESKYSEAFESAHSAVLAIFSSGKRCVPDLTRWYTRLLLGLADLSPTQLRLAYSTVVRSTSSFDDDLAWWCIQELVASVERLPVSLESNPEVPITTRARFRDLSEDSVVKDSPPVTPFAGDAESANPTALTVEARALTLARGARLLALVSLLPSVNLVLFQALLDEISRLVGLEPVASDGRTALGEWTFEVLGTGMDVVKREEGVRWWMEHGEELVNGRRETSPKAPEAASPEKASKTVSQAEDRVRL